jgi:small nuclear ribonucleoprotein G
MTDCTVVRLKVLFKGIKDLVSEPCCDVLSLLPSLHAGHSAVALQELLYFAVNRGPFVLLLWYGMPKVQPPELRKFMDKKISREYKVDMHQVWCSDVSVCLTGCAFLFAVVLNANRHVVGVLRGFDQFMNVVLDGTVDEKSKTDIGMVVRNRLLALLLAASCQSCQLHQGVGCLHDGQGILQVCLPVHCMCFHSAGSITPVPMTCLRSFVATASSQ